MKRKEPEEYRPNKLSTWTRPLILLLVWIGGGLLGLIVACVSKGNVPRIAVLQFAPAEWADALKNGFVEGLEEEGLIQSRDVNLVVKSASGDPLALTTIAHTLAREDFLAVYTLGTIASQEYFAAMSDETKGGMIFGAVTDPIAAGFYAGSFDHPKKNLTGSQDIWPYDQQFRIIRVFLPKTTTIGTLYNPNEVNTQASIKLAREAARAVAFQLLEKPISTSQEIDGALANLFREGVGAIYIPADNLTQSNSASIISVASEKKVPVFTGISGIVEKGAIATVGTNYIEVGRVNGHQAARLIKEHVKLKEIHPEIATKGDLYINVTKCRAIGLQIPKELEGRASIRY